MTPPEDPLADLALLASMSAVVHYFWGVYGLLATLVLAGWLEHGESLWAAWNDARASAALPATTKPRWRLDWRHDRVQDEADDVGSDDVARDEALPPSPPPIVEGRPPTDSIGSSIDLDDGDERAMDVAASSDVSRLHIRDVGGSQPVLSPLVVNAPAAVPFETDLFVGHVLFLVRTSPEHPEYAPLFEGKRRMFWIQVQGRFKREPRGAVFLGGELPAHIAPGFFTRSLALVIVGLIRQLLPVSHLNFSLGDAAQLELPSISFPLFQSVDQFVVTPEGRDPPPLGSSDFGESLEARQRRRQTPLGAENYAVGPTYSFHFHTMYVDLTKWQTVNLPGLSAMNLSSFFDALPLRLVAYDVHSEPSGRHLQRDKDYLFAFEIKYDRRRLRLDHEDEDQPDSVMGEAEMDDELELLSTGGSRRALGSDLSTMSSTNVSDASSLNDEDVTLLQTHRMFLARENARRLTQLGAAFLCWMEEVDLDSGTRVVHYVFSVKDLSAGDEDESDDKTDDEGSPPVRAGEKRHLAIVSAQALRALLSSPPSAKHEGDNDNIRNALAALRLHTHARIGSYSIITDEAVRTAELLQMMIAGDDDIASEGNEDESELAMRSALYQALLRRQWLQSPAATASSCSPSRLGVNLSRREKQELGVVFEGVAYRYVSDALLRQEVVQLTQEALLFYRSYSSLPAAQVPCDRIIGVRAVAVPLLAATSRSRDGAFALQVTTLGEEIVLCVGTEFARNAWLHMLRQHCDVRANAERGRAQDMHVCSATSARLRPANRVVLNSRSLFPPSSAALDDELRVVPTVAKATAMVEEALRRALAIHADMANNRHVPATKALAFLDCASALRAVDLQLMQDAGSHEQQLAFLLNLYHLVLAHAMIAHSFPRSKRRWDAFQRCMCYSLQRRKRPSRSRLASSAQDEGYAQVTVSIAEIEHVLLRARMPTASVPHLRMADVLQSSTASRLWGLGLSHPDFRVSLALAIHQSAADAKVELFTAGRVHEQLNLAASLVLANEVDVQDDTMSVVPSKEAVVTLPRVCDWYARDFGPTALDVLRKLLGFLGPETQLPALALLEREHPVRIKFHSFQYAPKDALLADASLTDVDRECRPEAAK